MTAGVGNYVTQNPPHLGNFMIADNFHPALMVAATKRCPDVGKPPFHAGADTESFKPVVGGSRSGWSCRVACFYAVVTSRWSMLGRPAEAVGFSRIVLVPALRVTATILVRHVDHVPVPSNEGVCTVEPFTIS